LTATNNATGIVFDLKKYAVHDEPGIRTTVFLKGCTLRCWWCHNPESQKLAVETITQISRRNSLGLSYSETKDVFGKEVTVEDIMREIDKDVSFYDESGGGVTFSGGEPLMQADFVRAVAARCAELDINTALDTSGYAPEAELLKVADVIDPFLYDIKTLDDAAHLAYTGVSNRSILRNLRTIDKLGKRIWIRYPLVPGVNDDERSLSALLDLIVSLKSVERVNILPYHRAGAGKYARLGREYMFAKTEEPSGEEAASYIARGTDLPVRIGG